MSNGAWKVSSRQPLNRSCSEHTQKGMTVLGVLILGALLVFFVLSALKLTPIYIEDASIKKSFADYEARVKAKDKTIGTSKKKVHAVFSRYFQVNDVRDVNESAIKVEAKKIQDEAKVIVSLDHNFEVPLMGNLYYMVKGSYSVTVDRMSSEEIEE